MLQLHGKDKTKLAGLRDYKDLCIEYMLNNEDSTLSFVYPKTSKYYDLIEEEEYIKTKKQEYIIKEKSVGDNYTSFKCILNLEDLEGKPWEQFESVEHTIDNALALAIAGTGWIVGKCSLKKKRTVRVTDTSSLGVVQAIRKTYRCDLVFNTLTKTIDVYEKIGEDKGAYFIESLNLKALDIQGNSYNYCTRIIPKGKDGLKISDVNNGKEYVENYQYSNKIKTIIWKDDRYTIAQNLKEDAEAKLEELSKPYRSYAATILNLAKLNDKYKDILDYKLGDTITLISKSNKFRDKQRIVKIVEYPDDHTKDTVELANTKLSFEEIQQEFQDAANTVSNITTDNGTIDGSTINSIKTEQISDFETSVSKVVDFTAINADIKNLKAQNVTITGSLTAVTAEIGTLTANVGNIDKLIVTHSAYINDLQSSKADITQLNAVNAIIQVVEADVGRIQTLVNGNLSSENIQAGGITSDRLTITNGFITNAMIANLDVAKVNSGDISTNKFRITSDSGNMLISDNTIQIRDSNRVRVQIGKDATNDYNMYVWDANGNLMFDATGLKSNGIKEKIIRDDMISDNANISGSKLNINSVVTSINNGTTTIKGSKVILDETNQTLDVGFNSLKTEVQSIEIGGTNLLLDSYLKLTTAEYLMSRVYLGDEKPKHGETVTITLKGTIGGSKLGFAIYNSGGSFRICTLEPGNLVKDSIYQVTVPWIVESAANTHIEIYNMWSSDSGTSTIDWIKVERGNKVSLSWSPNPGDSEKQISGLKEITTAQSTEIKIVQGQIVTAINNTQIIKDGQTILLKDDYNRTVQTVNSMSSTIGQHSTTINQQTGQITTVTAKVNTVERTLTSMSSKLNSVESTATTTKNKVSAIEQSLVSITARLSNTESTLSTTKSDVTQIKLDIKGITQRVDSVETTTNKTRKVVSFRYIRDWLGGSTVNGGKHFIELKVLVGDTNIAKGKIPFASQSVRTGQLSQYTDDIIDTNQYIEITGTDAWGYMQLDLGSVREDIDMLKVWHYYGDNRAYNHKLEVSRDGQTWFELFNSEVSGRYKESSEGRTYIINESNTEARLNYAESKITAKSIIDTVSSSFYTKGQCDVNYANKTIFEQTSKKFEYKFENNSYSNLFLNGNFANGTTYWGYWGHAKLTLESDCAVVSSASNTNDGFIGLLSTKFVVEKGKKYSLSLEAQSYWNIPWLNYICLLTDDGQIIKLDINFDINSNKLVYRTATFTSPVSKWVQLIIGTKGYLTTSSGFKIANVCLVEGDTPRRWTPNANEVSSGATSIDLNGVKVRFQDGSYAAMQYGGFAWWIQGMEKPYHCLCDTGWINMSTGVWNSSADSYDLKVSLPHYYRGKSFSVSTMLQGWYIPSDSPLNHVVVSIPYEHIDYTNATFIIRVKALTRAGEWQTNINFSWVSIA